MEELRVDGASDDGAGDSAPLTEVRRHALLGRFGVGHDDLCAMCDGHSS
jgi:hypothetical protein